MALIIDDQTPTPTFQWGPGGGRMTTDQIAARRKVADALALQAGDYSPIKSWTQGAARLAQGISAGLDYRAADKADQANADANKQMIAALLGGGGYGGSAATPSTTSAPPSVSPTTSVSPSVPEATSKAPLADAPNLTPNDPSPSASLNDTSVPASIRYNNPGAQWPGQSSTKFGANGYGVIGGGNKIAAFASPEDGAAAQFDLLNRSYANMPLADAVKKWSGGNSSDQYAADIAKATGISPDTVLTPELLRSPAAIGIAKAMAQHEAGRAYPMSDDQWQKAFAMANGGVKVASLDHGAGVGAPDGQLAAGGTASPTVDRVAAALAASPAAQSAQPSAPAAGSQIAQDDTLPVNATLMQGYAIPGQPAPVATPGVAKVSGVLSRVSPAVLQAATSPYSDDATKTIAGLILKQQMTPKDVHTQETDKDGNIWDVNGLTGQRTVALKADSPDKPPTSVAEYEYYKKNLPDGQTPIPYDVWSTAKARAAATNISNNIDMNSGQTYDKQLAEGLGKSHAALANGVEDAQSRARDIAAMQGAVDAIQKNNGTTGGMLPAQRLELQKSINAGAAALGIDKPFNESDLSDKEFLTKFNRSMAGAQAKNAVGSRVTNFEMSNFLKANPGLDMTVTGNQRLLGIQSQIEQRHIAVGNAIRDATAQAISNGKKIDPVTVQKIITDYDQAHHVQDPTTGQDLTQSYALPEFQSQGNNAALSAGHNANIGKIRRFNPNTGEIE